MNIEQNKGVVHRFYEAFTADDEAGLREALSPDLVAFSHGAPGPQDLDAHVQQIRGWNAAFETVFTVDEQIAEGDKVMTVVTMRATHNRGAFQGVPPSGKEVTMVGVTIERIGDGKIVERRVYSNFQELMQQLGLAPSPQPAA